MRAGDRVEKEGKKGTVIFNTKNKRGIERARVKWDYSQKEEMTETNKLTVLNTQKTLAEVE